MAGTASRAHRGRRLALGSLVLIHFVVAPFGQEPVTHASWELVMNVRQLSGSTMQQMNHRLEAQSSEAYRVCNLGEIAQSRPI